MNAPASQVSPIGSNTCFSKAPPSSPRRRLGRFIEGNGGQMECVYKQRLYRLLRNPACGQNFGRVGIGVGSDAEQRF